MLLRGHAQLVHHHQLAQIVSVRRDRAVAAHGDLDASAQGGLVAALAHLDHALRDPAALFREGGAAVGCLQDAGVGDQRQEQVCAVLQHQLDRLLVEFGAVLDRATPARTAFLIPSALSACAITNRWAAVASETSMASSSMRKWTLAGSS